MDQETQQEIERLNQTVDTNGLIRQYFTKGSCFEHITDEQVEAVMNKLNHRPRKTLNYKTPHSVFFSDTESEAA